MSRINEIRARCEAATPGEWRTPPTFSGICSQSGDILAINRIVNPHAADMIFIAYAREDIPFLLDELATKDAELQRYKQLEAESALANAQTVVTDMAIKALQEKSDRERPSGGWVSVDDGVPEAERIVLVVAKYANCPTFGVPFVSMAAHVGYHERTTEDWPNYEGDTEYDEENDCYWVRPCWYEVNIVDDNPNWELCEGEITVTHWMLPPGLPRKEEAE